jgi:hypothetical protein
MLQHEQAQENKPGKQTASKLKPKQRGAPRGNRNAAKVGEELRLELFLSKPRRKFFEEWFSLKYGRAALNEDELREMARQLANAAIDQAIVEEFKLHYPNRFGGSEVF